MKQDNPDDLFFYMDIFSTQNLNDFVKLFASAVFGKITSSPQKTISRIGKFIKSFRPVLSFDEFSGAPQLTVDINPAIEESSLQEIFTYLQASKKKCYVAIDEFQQIRDYPEKGVEALLRSYIQLMPNVNFIFSGSKRHIMQDMFMSAKRPFYQSTQILTLDTIDSDKYYHFAVRFFSAQGGDLSSDTFLAIYKMFNGHTWYIQILLNRLYGYRKKPDDKLVNQVVAEILAESGATYESLLAAYSANNIRLLKAVAKEKCVKELNAGDFISRYQLKSPSSVNTSLKKLTDKELLYNTSEGTIVYDRFMAFWLRQQPY